MSQEHDWQYDLDEYIRQGEPDRLEKSAAWQTAIGLQDVDGLQTSDYLLETNKDHIHGTSVMHLSGRTLMIFKIMSIPQRCFLTIYGKSADRHTS